ncbi:hypothetical protein Esti_006068 [Eimeria stiedai]
MTDAILRREIKRLVEQQKILNQRLQRKPPRENRGPLGPRLTADGDTKDSALADHSENAAEPGGPEKRPQGAGGPPYNFEGPEFQVAKRPKIELDANSAKRNKRMFGFLSSHLNKAKQQLTKEQDTDFAQRHKLQEERVNSKLELARKHIAEIARIQWQEQRKEDESQLAKVSQELIEKENDLMRFHLVQHYTNMEHFVGTEAQPTLFWRPAEWDAHTRRLQQQTRVWIQTKIKHIQEADFAFNAEADGEDAEEQEEAGEAPDSPEEKDSLLDAGSSKA